MADLPKVFDAVTLNDGTSNAYHYQLDVTENSYDASAGTVNVTITLRTWSTYNQAYAFVWTGVNDYTKPVMGIYVSDNLVANSNNSTFYLDYRRARDLNTAHTLTWTGNVNYISTGVPIRGVVNVAANTGATSIASGAHTVSSTYALIGESSGDTPTETVVPASGNFNSDIIPSALWLIVKWQEGNINYTNKTSDVEVDITIHHGGLIHTSKPCTITLGDVSTTINSPAINTRDYTSHLGTVTLSGIQHLSDGTYSSDLIVHWACDMQGYPSSNPKAVPYVEAKHGITLCTIPDGSGTKSVDYTQQNLILLYESDERQFDHNGFGSMKDAITCKVIEKLNDQYELTMTYPVFGKRYDDLQLGRIILAKPNYYTRPQPFSIYSISKPLKGIVTINAEHISYRMSRYPVEEFEANSPSEALSLLSSKCVVSSPFTFETNLSAPAASEDYDITFYVNEPASQRSILGSGNNSITSYYGGELEFDRFKVKLLQNRGIDRGVTVRYGKNLTDFTQEESNAEVYSQIFPYYRREDSYGNVTYVTIDDAAHDNKKTIDTGSSVANEGVYILDLTQYFESTPSKSELRSMAEAWLEVNDLTTPVTSITVSFLQLSQSPEYKKYVLLEKVLIGDTVHVIFPRLNVNVNLECVGTTYDCITQKYTKIELGDLQQTLAETIADATKS